MQNIAVILAGGSGKRIGGDIPKQFFKVAGKTILEYSIEKFEAHPDIHEMIIVGHPDHLETIRGLTATGRFRKVSHILPGGQERYHSVLAALGILGETECNLLIHDAVRPAVSHRIIGNVIAGLGHYRAVNVAIPATDTIIEVDLSGTYITGIPDRSRLYQVQTPQGFRAETLKQAYSVALNDPEFRTTDDCSVVCKYMPEEKIGIIKGDMTNIKLTYPEDFLLMEYLLTKEI